MRSLIHLSSTSFLRALILASGVLVGTPLVPAEARAQVRPDIPDPSDTIYEVRLSDGTVTFARLVAVDKEKVVLTTIAGGRLEIERSHIVGLRQAAGEVVNGEFWNEDPSSSRLFFTATGRTLRQGESYLGTYLFVFPFGAYGFTDRIMIGAGAPVLLGHAEPFYVAPKVLLVDGPRARISLGTLALFFDDERVGIVYGVGTFGSTDEAVSAGIGYFYDGDDLKNNPAFMFGGEIRTDRRIKLISENYILPERAGLIFSGGIRVIGDRIATEVAIVATASEGDSWCCLPLLNFTYAPGN
ncbi:MAG: hypothetical protein OXG58_09340 [Gemmatimonadetes bacterium]|nr:hypothetical protein [Gemmatimonadota bacterium]MCY3944055.1 hypothetical protein [Gemmatimonadota bacterium]